MERQMLFDLTRALLAAVAVGVAPGYFWARLLRATGDRAELLAYSIALSITLVPAVILIPARMFGMGVTLSVTILCVVFVFFTGLAAYLVFGLGKDADEGPVIPPSTPLGLLTLALIFPAFGLALVSFSGLAFAGASGNRVMSAVSLLLLFAVIVQRIEPRHAPSPTSSSDTSEARKDRWLLARRFALPLVLVAVIFRGYSGPVSNDWPYLRGGDLYSHAVMANMMQTVGSVKSYLVYPPGLHTVDAAISRLSGLEPVDLFTVYAPALLLLPTLALYAVAKRLWGWGYGVTAAAVGGILLNSSYGYFGDSMYPNLVSAEFLLVMAVGALFVLYASPSPRSGLLFALLGSSVALYHPVASSYAAALFALVGVFLLPYLLFHERRTGVILLLSMALLGMLSVAYAWDTYDLSRLVTGLVDGSGTSAGGQAVETAIGTQDPFPLEHLLVTISQPVLWLGLLGALLLTFGTGRARELTTAPAMARLTLLFWTLILFVGSRTALSGFPQRFERDLGMPLALFAAYGLGMVLVSAWQLARSANLGTFAVGWAAVTVIGVLVIAQTTLNMEQATQPSDKLLMAPQIKAAGKWLEAHNEGGNIMISPRGNQVPGRAMLALSHYTALEAFTAERIAYNRDLPPYGAGPLLDVLYVIDHPDDQHVRELLKKHAVDYVVFYKQIGVGTDWRRAPASEWQSHKTQRDLYIVAYENSYVLVLKPRASSLAG